MPTYRDEVVVLRTHKLGEADRIVTMLSRRHGKLRAVAKGVRRTSSRFGARLEPFMVADVQLYQGRSLDIVQQAESLGSYGADIAVHYDRYTSAHAMVEAADRLNEAEATPQQYLLLVGGLRALAARRARRRAASSIPTFCARWRSRAGRRGSPSARAAARPGPHDTFVAQLGGMVCRDCAPTGAARVDAARRSQLLQSLMAGEWDAVDAASRGDLGAAASGLIAAYAQWHLERGIRSLAARPSPGGAPMTPKPYTHRDAVAVSARSTGPGCIRPRSRRARCRSTSRSSWTATAAGRTAGD